nr:arginine--tRNA ligase [uncultured Treponema sp.]
MDEIRTIWKENIAHTLTELLPEGAEPVTIEHITMEVPPDPQLGDLGFPLFTFAKLLRLAPAKIAAELLPRLAAIPQLQGKGEVKAVGPYINVFLPKGDIAAHILETIFNQNDDYGKTSSLAGKKIMVEFSSPNTNKPLHLGHLRNDAIGESLSRILTFSGAEVYKTNIINDRGVHICKSMLAYRLFGNGIDPVKEGIKPDKFVGDMYVRFHKYSKEHPEAEEEAQALLRKWEAGDPETLELWTLMNGWALQGIQQTYKRTGVSFDKLFFESQVYRKGRAEILEGLERGVFYKDEDNSVWIDLAPIGLDKKVLLRGDGTALYITQDIGLAITRHGEWPFDKLIYVVGNEQIYHFKVLFYVLKQLGYEWYTGLHHLAYGMVNLPEGKMKSREGTVVDADDLITDLKNGALEEIAAKGREEAVGNPEEVAEKVALGALHYFLLQVDSAKDMLFNTKESLSFNGNTGPYIQYMGARISSILRKADTDEGKRAKTGTVKPELLNSAAEWELLKKLEEFPAHIDKAAAQYTPAVISGYLYDVCKLFSKFYHDCPILAAENPDVAATRLALARAVRTVLKNATQLILVPFLEVM